MQKGHAFSLTAALLASGLLLTACGGGSSGGGGGTATTTVSGTAATGAPMAGATISARCRNNWNGQATAAANGGWSLPVPTANMPCVLKATPSGSGSSYYGLALDNGSAVTANITPLTSLTLAYTGTVPDATWFASADSGTVAGIISQALTKLRAALQAAGYQYGGAELPAGFNPLTTAFQAEAGNAYDDLLEALQTALNGADFDTLLQDAASDEPLPEAPTEDTPTTPANPDVSGPLSAPASATYTESFINLAGDYKLEVTAASAGGENIFNIGDVVSVKIQNAGPPYSITYTEKSGGAIKTRSFDTNVSFHKEGSGATATDVLDIKGRFSSDGALQARYQPSNGHLILYFSGFYGSTHEGLATLENRSTP